MSRRHSLSVQLLFGVVLSLLAAALVFLLCAFVGTTLLDRTVYGRPFMEHMTDHQFEALQRFVLDEGVTAENLRALDAWCSQGDELYLTVYLQDHIIYESTTISVDELPPEDYDPDLENQEREYSLQLSDGTQVRAFLYYFTGDIYYFGVMFFSALAAFLMFCLCFVTLVHRKLRYIQHMKAELDILAGGDLGYSVTVKGNDELSDLADGIDQMRRSIMAHQTAEEKMRSANAELVTAMSHDLRTPLTSLLAYLEMLERGKYEDNAQQRQFIGKSLEKALQIKDMADKLFEYFLVYAVEWEQPELEETDADSLFRQFWGEYAFSLESGGFRVRQDFRELRGTVSVNLELLRRAFDNLYSNLLKYADPAAQVVISCQREGVQAELTLVNRVSPKRDAKQRTNIGLNTCDRIIRAHGGSFLAEEQDGVFRVTVTLPLSDAENPHGIEAVAK